MADELVLHGAIISVTPSLKINVNIISNGFFQLRYGFAMAAAEADMNFGAMAKVLEKATTVTPPNLSGYKGPKASKLEDLGDVPTEPNTL